MSQAPSQGYRLVDLENVLSEKGWSQADLARRSGLSTPTIGKAASANEKVSASSAKKIAGALRMQVATLCQSRETDGSIGSVSSDGDVADTGEFDPRRMRQAMAERGMSPTEIAARTELAAATVSSALRGLRNPTENTLSKISEALGKAPEELCEGAGGHPHSPAAQGQEQSPAGELRLVAGQSKTTLYPDAVGTDNDTSKQWQDVVKPLVTDPGKADDQSENGSLGGLLRHLQQARQMVGSLMEHIEDLESQVGRAIGSQDELERGVNASSEGR